jgi:hypothetical protein
MLLLSRNLFAAPTEVRINLVRDQSTYMLDLLRSVLARDGLQYKFAETNERLSKQAEREAALSGDIGVFWGGTSEADESDFIPVRIDAYRGLMSLRFLIIRKNEQPLFSKITNLGQLQEMAMGQGCAWQDATILKSAGLSVACATKKESLFYMLEGDRFDAFPRGATEAWVEAAANTNLGLAVESKLVVRYPLPTYYFVSKKMPRLAADIESGLLAALRDGSFDRFFYKNERVQTFLSQAQLDQRRVIDLENPFLPLKSQNTQLDSSALDIEQLVEGYARLQTGAFD